MKKYVIYCKAKMLNIMEFNNRFLAQKKLQELQKSDEWSKNFYIIKELEK